MASPAPAPALTHPPAVTAAADAAAATLSPLKYAIGALLVQFDRWKQSNPHTGDVFTCDVAIDQLAGPDRDSFMCAFVASGFRVAQVARDGKHWFRVECTVVHLKVKQAPPTRAPCPSSDANPRVFHISRSTSKRVTHDV